MLSVWCVRHTRGVCPNIIKCTRTPRFPAKTLKTIKVHSSNGRILNRVRVVEGGKSIRLAGCLKVSRPPIRIRWIIMIIDFSTFGRIADN